MTATMTAMTTIVTTKKRPSNASQMTKSAFQECAAQNERQKEKTARFAKYGLMMAARRNARKSKTCRATIRDGMIFFSGDSLSNAKPIPEEDREEWVLGVALAQYSITAGLKKFKQKGKNGVTKELTQMHDINVFTPVLKEFLSSEERAKALVSLMFLKEKRDKTVKARMCADGRKQ